MKLKYNAPVVLTFAILSGMALGLNELTHGAGNALLFVTGRGPLTDPLTYVRLFTHVLGHVSPDHYMGNMMLFLLLGPMLEEKYGSRNLALVIGITAVVTGLVNALIGTQGLLGASGVVFAFIILASMTSFSAGEIPVTLVLVVLLYIGREVENALFTADEISQITHLVGGAMGGICGYWSVGGKKRKNPDEAKLSSCNPHK